MKINLCECSLLDTLEVVEELLANASGTSDKKEKDKCINRAYGIVNAIGILLTEETEEAETERV